MIRPLVVPQALLRAGAARCDVTPPVGCYHRMWGAAVHDRSTGVHRPLVATALILAPAESPAAGGTNAPDDELVLIAIDHCLFWATEMQIVLAGIEQVSGVPRSRISVCFSHTHGAGLMDLARADLPGGDLIRPYLEALGPQLGQLVNAARSRLRPAHLSVGRGRCDLASNRDLFDADSGQWVCGTNPDGPVDDTVLVARLTKESGAAIASLVNYACHPTTLAWDNTLVSPDYVGALYETVERDVQAPCLFLQGASGEVGPREGFVGDTAVADRNGRQLGFAALSALAALPAPGTQYEYVGPVVSGATIGAWAHRPWDETETAAARRFVVRRFTVDLPYPPDRPTLEQIEARRAEWAEKEQIALAAHDAVTARDCRAMIERQTRALTRYRELPPGDAYPFPVVLARTGDVLWLFVEGEPYQALQTELRARFPQATLFVTVLTNGSTCSYLPRAETYGRGLYQQSVALLAPGCLERLIAALVPEIDRMLQE